MTKYLKTYPQKKLLPSPCFCPHAPAPKKYVVGKQTTNQIITPQVHSSMLMWKKYFNHTMKKWIFEISPEKKISLSLMLHPLDSRLQTHAPTKSCCPKTDNKTNNHLPYPCFHSNVKKIIWIILCKKVFHSHAPVPMLPSPRSHPHAPVPMLPSKYVI